MKKILLLLLFPAINITLTFSQNNKKYNITDYFLLLPDSIFQNLEVPLDAKQRQIALKYKKVEDIWNNNGYWMIDTTDYRNGYMKISTTGDGAGTQIEITYFIKTDKSRITAVNIIKWDMANTCSYLKFYTFKNNIWKDITDKVLPDINISYFIENKYKYLFSGENKFLFKLPQKGKNIKVKICPGTTDELLNENKITEKEYNEINNTIKEKTLYWNDGTFIRGGRKCRK